MTSKSAVKKVIRQSKGQNHDSPSNPIECVNLLLHGYAERRVFHGFSQGAMAEGKTTFKMLWHYNRIYSLILDEADWTFHMPALLFNVPARSVMYRDLKSYILSFYSDQVLEHRRIDRDKADIRPTNRGGTVSLVLKVKGAEYEYSVRKLVNLVHEIFLTFLIQGIYYDYRIQSLGMDPDANGGFF